MASPDDDDDKEMHPNEPSVTRLSAAPDTHDVEQLAKQHFRPNVLRDQYVKDQHNRWHVFAGTVVCAWVARNGLWIREYNTRHDTTPANAAFWSWNRLRAWKRNSLTTTTPARATHTTPHTTPVWMFPAHPYFDYITSLAMLSSSSLTTPDADADA